MTTSMSLYINLQSVRMKGIQNKIIISQEEFIIHINGLHHYKGKLTIFLCVYNFLNKFQRGLPWWHDKYPGLKHVWCYRSHRAPMRTFFT
jgi:hypothetical protein